MTSESEAIRSHIMRLDPQVVTRLRCAEVVSRLGLGRESAAVLQLAATMAAITSHSHAPCVIRSAQALDVAIAGHPLAAVFDRGIPRHGSEAWVESQYFLKSTRARVRPGAIAPSRSDFCAPSADHRSSKPGSGALYTSTGMTDCFGMWQLHLELAGEEGLLGPPYHVFHMRPDLSSRIHVVDDAASWVELLGEFGESQSGAVAPDWRRVAEHHDAVHLTCRGVASIQGVTFDLGAQRSAPAFWDVETTAWLRWRFAGVTTVKPGSSEWSGGRVRSPLSRPPRGAPIC